MKKLYCFSCFGEQEVRLLLQLTDDQRDLLVSICRLINGNGWDSYTPGCDLFEITEDLLRPVHNQEKIYWGLTPLVTEDHKVYVLKDEEDEIDESKSVVGECPEYLRQVPIDCFDCLVDLCPEGFNSNDADEED